MTINPSWELEQYYILGQQEKMIKDRRKQLRDDIIKHHCLSVDGGRTWFRALAITGWDVKVQTKRRQKVDDSALEQLLVNKGLWDQCKKEVVDHDLVEQAYIEGKITDKELRSIDGGRDVYLALTVEKVETDGIQGDDESGRGGEGDRTLHDRIHSKDPAQISGDDTSLGETKDTPKADVS